MKRRPDHGFGNAILNLMLCPRNPFDVKRRREFRPGLLFAIVWLGGAVALFVIFNCLLGRSERVPVFIETGGFFEVLARKDLWIGLLTPAGSNLIGPPEAVGLLRPRETTSMLEQSVLLTHLWSIAASRPSGRKAPRSSEPAAPRHYLSGLSRRNVRHAAE